MIGPIPPFPHHLSSGLALFFVLVGGGFIAFDGLSGTVKTVCFRILEQSIASKSSVLKSNSGLPFGAAVAAINESSLSPSVIIIFF
jgi:hypothetical protein